MHIRVPQGQWVRQDGARGADSSLHSPSDSQYGGMLAGVVEIKLGEIIAVQPEPAWKQHLVTVEYARGGKQMNVPVPGPNLAVDISGAPSGIREQIHGLWAAPLPGQMVAVAYAEGDAQNPVVLNTYPYCPSPKPWYQSSFYLPMTKTGHGPTDVVLGHHTGSFLALRGTLPVPGAVDFYAATELEVEAEVAISQKTVMYSVEAEIISVEGVDVEVSGAVVTITTENLKISMNKASNAIDIEGIAGAMINVKPGPGGFLNLGNNPTQLCNNLPQCIFSGGPHSSSIDTKV